MNTTCRVFRSVGKCRRGCLQSAVRAQAMDRLKKGLVIVNRPPADDTKLRRNSACSLSGHVLQSLHHAGREAIPIDAPRGSVQPVLSVMPGRPPLRAFIRSSKAAQHDG